jgi:NSS family neurotransmitter:Na+ symporter
MVSAGCAVGLGNVWKFPYLCGQYGGAAFILIYLLCLALIATPILICELSVGRASQKSSAKSFNILEPPKTKWHITSFMCIAGTYLLMAFYTAVCGWMLYYFFKYLIGDFAALTSPQEISDTFTGMLRSPGAMIGSTVIVIIASFSICALGVQKGVEKITKYMMCALFIILGILAVNSVLLPNADKGLEFYLVPNFDAIAAHGIGNVLFAAMSQAFFTLSIGIGAMAMFGSYLDKSRSLTGEAITISCLDTLVAIIAGLIIIPACFSFNINPETGPSLIFITMPNVFRQMTGGQIWGALFFLFLLFAALSTVVAVFENIVAYAIELFGFSRKKAIIINLIALIVLSMPCILGFNVLSGFEPLGTGSNILDLEDFLVTNNLLPLGALIYLMFCTHKNGWGWNNFLAETDSGTGMKFPVSLRFLMQYILPFLIVIIYIKGYYDKFSSSGTVYLIIWLSVALIFLGFVGYCAFYKARSEREP